MLSNYTVQWWIDNNYSLKWIMIELDNKTVTKHHRNEIRWSLNYHQSSTVSGKFSAELIACLIMVLIDRWLEFDRRVQLERASALPQGSLHVGPLLERFEYRRSRQMANLSTRCLLRTGQSHWHVSFRGLPKRQVKTTKVT